MFLLFFLYSSFIPQLNLEINTSKSILITLIILLLAITQYQAFMLLPLDKILTRQAYYKHFNINCVFSFMRSNFWSLPKSSASCSILLFPIALLKYFVDQI